jgi:hypothetical protein
MNASPEDFIKEFKFACPSCGQRILAEFSAAGTSQVCPTCNQTFLVPDPPQNNEAEEKNENFSYFELAERVMLKMILGVLKFIFWVVPREIFQFLEQSIPVIVNWVRICILFVMWLALVIWPFILKRGFLNPVIELFGYQNPMMFNTGGFALFCDLWITLAICGSIWGITNIMLKKRRHQKNLLEKR